MNEDLLNEIQRHILLTPQQFHIGYWHQGDILPEAQDKCGSTACIGGWALVLSQRVRLSSLGMSGIEDGARQVLRLDHDQSGRLFLGSLWPDDLWARYVEWPSTFADWLNNAQVASERIDRFIQSGGAE